MQNKEKIEKIRAHVFISGRVQSVFFRSETCKMARDLGITGWVRNLEDGRVGAVFEGKEDKVKKIVEWCKRGPLLAKVENTEISFETYKGEFESFEKID